MGDLTVGVRSCLKSGRTPDAGSGHFVTCIPVLAAMNPLGLPLVGTSVRLRPVGAPRNAITRHEVTASRAVSPSGRTAFSSF